MLSRLSAIISIVGVLSFVWFALNSESVTQPLYIGVCVAMVFFTVGYILVRKIDNLAVLGKYDEYKDK